MRTQASRGALLVLVALISAASLAAQTPAATSAPAAAVRVPAGERIILELEDSLHTRHSYKGDHAHFTTTDEVLVGSQLVIPAGSSVRATLLKVEKPGRAGRSGEITLQFDEIILPDGTTLPLDARLLRAGFLDLNGKGTRVRGEHGSGAHTAATIAMATAEGALLGVSVAGGKGAAYGSAAGAAIGLAMVLMQKGPHVDLPRGTLFEVELKTDLAVPVVSANRFAQLAPAQPAGSAGFPADATTAPLPAAEESIPDFSNDAPASTEAATAPVATESSTTIPISPPPPQPDPTEDVPVGFRLKVDVRLVQVEAVVRDPDGRVFDSLHKEDFRIFEDGIEQTVRSFSRDELPLAVALVVDRSESVAPYMSELRRAAYQALSRLKPGDQVALFAFDSDVERLMDLTTDRRAVAEEISRIRAGGGTNIVDAVYMAAQYLGHAARNRRRAIILVSDNQATMRRFATQSSAIRMALEAEVVVYSIKTPGEPSPLLLKLGAVNAGSVRTITRETGGEVVDVRSTGSLEGALQAVVTRLRTRYTLGYQSTNKALDGGFRQIEVRLVDRFGQAGKDYAVTARKGYYAPTETVARAQP